MVNDLDLTNADDLRYAIFQFLNKFIIGFLEGTHEGMKGMVVDNFKRKFGMDITREQVKIVVDNLENPRRRCLSVHVDVGNDHYESVIRNILYHDGWVDY